MEIIPLGDSALIIRMREQFHDAAEGTLDQILEVFQRLHKASIPGVIELAPAYTSVAVFFDPIVVAKANEVREDIFDFLVSRIRAVVVASGDRGRRQNSSRNVTRTIDIPVCYAPEFAPDMDDVARRAKITGEEVVDLHSAAKYRVACIGFVPGFPFLTGLPKKLATPRRDVPRREIPPGSVGIGGAQTGIYPLRSPGGWNLIGRTPLKLFDTKTNPPTLLRPGDHVRFCAITREEFEHLKS